MLNFTEFTHMISNNIPDLELRYDVPMAKLTSFRIGGPAACAAFPKSEEQLVSLLKLCAAESVEPVVLGAGTNVLAPDAGMEKLIIVLKDALDAVLSTMTADDFNALMAEATKVQPIE